MSTAAQRAPAGATARKTVKCVVWDLDGTLWDGILLEDGEVTVRPDVVATIESLSDRGILHAIASRNDHDAAMERLVAAGLEEHFVYPQINWLPKSASVAEVARLLNVGIDTLAFVDDQPFELEEVAFAHPDVLCLDAGEIVDAAATRPEFQPRFVTDESRIRRHLYRSEERRVRDEAGHEGTSEEFLATLGMRFTIAQAEEEDLQRAEELTVRTNQLNSTGRTYSYEELAELRRDPGHLLLVASLEDRYGPYGKIGLALVERGSDVWMLRLLLMSCRVMSRGVGTVLLNHVMRLARESGARLRAELVETGRNRMMYVTYAFAGFAEVERDGDRVLLEGDLSRIQDPPPYLQTEIL
ncbi:MAG TPA: HAD-IIIC family phosphatase [Solirubrobacteraceae bacterium]|nr:HAD-IIIC family phosphatase [Solirubrobacteraceae bacterium]